MLNAFRHHGTDHTKAICACSRVVAACSTPSGITDPSTLKTRSTSVGALIVSPHTRQYVSDTLTMRVKVYRGIRPQPGPASIVEVMSIPLPVQAPAIREDDGTLRVGRSGVTLETVLWAFQEGASPEIIQRQFPSLELADIYDVIAYYLRQRQTVDDYLREREQVYHETNAQLERDFPQDGTRARLLARLKR
jgi:uncharacterized protein (DUF433 family)